MNNCVKHFIVFHHRREGVLRGIARAIMRRFLPPHVRKIRLGVAYNLYDGEELLEASVKSIRNAADYVCVVYQDVSNGGVRRVSSLDGFLKRLVALGIVDEAIKYDPDLSISRSENESIKRLIGLRACRKAHCSHFLGMDVDEFYREEELEKAKDFIARNGIDVSAVSIIEYIKDPSWRLVSSYVFPPHCEGYLFHVPFISRIKAPSWEFPYPCLVDPTRGFLRAGRFYLFPRHEIAMHHMSTIRTNLEVKFANSTLGEDEQFAKTKQMVMGYEFKDGAICPPGYGFFNTNLVKHVVDEFGIRDALNLWHQATKVVGV